MAWFKDGKTIMFRCVARWTSDERDESLEKPVMEPLIVVAASSFVPSVRFTLSLPSRFHGL